MVKTILRTLCTFGFIAGLSVVNSSRASTVVWTNLAGGNWTAAANWSPNQLPGANDDAFITNAGTYTVTLNSASAVSNLVLGLDLPGGTPTLSVQHTLTLHGGGNIGTNGVVDFIGTLDGAGTVTNRGLFNLYSSVVQGAGLLVNEPQGRIIEPFAFGVKYFYRKLVNRGVYDRSGSAAVFLNLSTLGAITNEPGGVINLGAYGFDGSAPAAVVNQGTINMLSLASVQPSWINPPFFNQGTLNVGVSNSLSLYYGYIYSGGTNTGTINIAPNSFLFNQTGILVLESGTQLLGTGALISQNTGEILFNTPLTSSNQIYCGWSLSSPSIRLNANLTSLNSFNLATGGRLYLTNPDVTLDCKNFFVGTASAFVTNAATIQANLFQVDSGTVHNSSLVNVRSNFNFNGGSLYGFGAATFNTLAGSINTIAAGAGKNFYTTLWNNHGTVTFNNPDQVWFLNSHWINHTGGVVNASGSGLVYNTPGYTNSFVNHGLLQRSGINGGPAFDLPTTNHGRVKLLGTTITLGAFTQLTGSTDISGSTVNGAKFHILGGELAGAATVQSSPSLYNASQLRPGSPLGTLSLTGPFTNATAGVYHMQIAETNNYDRVNVNNAVTLAGTLNVTFTNGFFPTIGNTFTALTWTARSGAFDQIVTPDYEFEILYTATNLLLRASNALPSVTLVANGGAATQLVCNPFKITSSAGDLDGVVTNLTVTLNGATVMSSSGGSLNSTAELDFATNANLIATARDDRGGTKSVTQQVQIVTWPLHTLTLGGIRSNGFKICMGGQSGASYMALASTNINLPVTDWTELGLMQPTNGVWRFFDAGTITNRPARYYRARLEDEIFSE